MTAEELNDNLYYDGQFRALRKVCIEHKLVCLEDLALMTTKDVCAEIAKHFEILGSRDGGETILLVKKDKWDAVMKNVVPLYR